jgi:hypothetical protein
VKDNTVDEAPYNSRQAVLALTSLNPSSHIERVSSLKVNVITPEFAL